MRAFMEKASPVHQLFNLQPEHEMEMHPSFRKDLINALAGHLSNIESLQSGKRCAWGWPNNPGRLPGSYKPQREPTV